MKTVTAISRISRKSFLSTLSKRRGLAKKKCTLSLKKWNWVCRNITSGVPGQAGSLRIDKKLGGGGSAVARPIGQLVIGEFLSAVLRERVTLQAESIEEWAKRAKVVQHAILERLFKEVSTNLDDVSWYKLIWNPETRTITGGKKERRLIVNLLLDKFDLKYSIGRRQLLKDYRETTQDKKMKLLSTTKPEDGSDGEESSHDVSSTIVAPALHNFL